MTQYQVLGRGGTHPSISCLDQNVRVLGERAVVVFGVFTPVGQLGGVSGIAALRDSLFERLRRAIQIVDFNRALKALL